ncbi:hypothetical protein D3C81_1131850 [compost metagenome]
MVAELLVVVIAHAGLQRVRAELALVLDEHAGVVAVLHVERGGAGDLVVLPVGAGGQLLAFGELDVALHAGGVTTRIEVAGEGAGAAGSEVVVGLVAVAADLCGQLERVGHGPCQLAAVDLLHVVGFVAAKDAAVVFVEAVGIEHVAFQAQRVGQCIAGAHVDGGVAVAIAVRLIGEAACAPAGGGATAGVDAVGLLVAALGRNPTALATVAETGAGLAQVVAACGQRQVLLQALARGTGEDLDHAADGFGAVQARTRAAHDFNALDLVDRQVLQRSHAAGRRADAHAVHQHQYLVGVGTAQEKRGDLAGAALVGEVQTCAAAQQFQHRVGLAAVDLLAVDQLHRHHAVLECDGGAGGGDGDVVQLGRCILCSGNSRQSQRQGEGKGVVMQFHGSSWTCTLPCRRMGWAAMREK